MSRFFRRWSSTTPRRPGPIHVPLSNAGLVLHTLSGALLLHAFFTYGYSFRLTQGSSMMPNFEEFGTWVLVNPKYRRGRGVEVGDCVTYKHPFIENRGGLKRVVGMPGDFVLMGTPGKGEGKMMQVPDGHCMVAGDNLAWSRDSRLFGPLPLGLIKGKVEAKVWPPKVMCWLENGLKEPEYAEE
ncbi:LexA/Signal peptidase [Saccharata proteae CBS 121410]|uniref:LexA/Signal peptidase n=1 Tax=Saccharata proteae CBS 121410 TaxID=1314787 RepID=A0A9P4HV81_9PEZI|nr:LexA/Signal peptidase [Saccharata proteae CBS 121410]